MPQQTTPGWSNREVAGASVTLHGRRITPIARTLRVGGRWGDFVWQRPVAVEVREGDRTYRVGIPNTTRRVLVALVLASASLAALVLMRGRTRAS